MTAPTPGLHRRKMCVRDLMTVVRAQTPQFIGGISERRAGASKRRWFRAFSPAPAESISGGAPITMSVQGMERTFKFRLSPTAKQVVGLERQLMLCRRLYNASLEQRITAWRQQRVSITHAMQSRELPTLRDEMPEFMGVQHHVLQATLRRVDRAFQGFFRRAKAKKGRAGFPRFKGRDRYRSLTFDVTGIKVQRGRLHLSKVGVVRMVQHREIPGPVKQAIVKQDAVGDWWACLSVEMATPPKVPIQKVIGVDLGLTHLVTTSDGLTTEAPRSLAGSLKVLRREQRRLSRKQKGGQNRRKQRIKVAKVLRKVERQRSDYLRKAAKRLVESADALVFEDLSVRNMMGNHRLARSIGDAAWGELVRMTAAKAEEAGRTIILVDPRGTTQECSGCGGVVPKTLSERVHRCPCGVTMDRDLNAAKVILQRGIDRLPSDRREVMPVETGPTPPLAGGEPMSAKQEATPFRGW